MNNNESDNEIIEKFLSKPRFFKDSLDSFFHDELPYDGDNYVEDMRIVLTRVFKEQFNNDNKLEGFFWEKLDVQSSLGETFTFILHPMIRLFNDSLVNPNTVFMLKLEQFMKNQFYNFTRTHELTNNIIVQPHLKVYLNENNQGQYHVSFNGVHWIAGKHSHFHLNDIEKFSDLTSALNWCVYDNEKYL